jgi:hypothetical protein
MDWLIWSGAAVSVAGIAGLVWCIIFTMKARRAGLDEPALRARLQRAVVVNLAALMVAALGLMMVVMGILLG